MRMYYFLMILVMGFVGGSSCAEEWNEQILLNILKVQQAEKAYQPQNEEGGFDATKCYGPQEFIYFYRKIAEDDEVGLEERIYFLGLANRIHAREEQRQQIKNENNH